MLDLAIENDKWYIPGMYSWFRLILVFQACKQVIYNIEVGIVIKRVIKQHNWCYNQLTCQDLFWKLTCEIIFVHLQSYLLIYLHWKSQSIFSCYLLFQYTQLRNQPFLAAFKKVFTPTNKSRSFHPLSGHLKWNSILMRLQLPHLIQKRK